MKTKKELLKLPFRNWEETTEYDEILLVPSGLKHDSGYMTIAIIGVIDNEPKEICGFPDDINWNMQNFKPPYGNSSFIRTDCYYPQGIIRFWSNYAKFSVGVSLSSVDIKILNK